MALAQAAQDVGAGGLWFAPKEVLVHYKADGTIHLRSPLALIGVVDNMVGETTDKGYINQRGVLKRRADLVEDLYAASPSVEVIHL